MSPQARLTLLARPQIAAMLILVGCGTSRFERLYCREVEKCFPDEECAWAAWQDDPRCAGCAISEDGDRSAYIRCIGLIEARRDIDGCLDTESQTELNCSLSIRCPADAPPECTPDRISEHLDPP